MKYIYGPVQSRRLGLSLGVSLTPYKTCNFDCVYCQLGPSSEKQGERKEYVAAQEILSELNSWLSANSQQQAGLTYITISGSGEPTLNSKIGFLISEIKKATGIKIAVITNSSQLKDPALRNELKEADLIVPSLDAVTQEVFDKIDRPLAGIKVEEIIEGLVALRKEFKGEIWLEVMLAKGINDDLRHIKKLKIEVDKINPDRIQLNSPVRAPKEAQIFPVAQSKLKKIREILGEKCEII